MGPPDDTDLCSDRPTDGHFITLDILRVRYGPADATDDVGDHTRCGGVGLLVDYAQQLTSVQTITTSRRSLSPV